jgi:hypothetical protein
VPKYQYVENDPSKFIGIAAEVGTKLVLGLQVLDVWFYDRFLFKVFVYCSYIWLTKRKLSFRAGPNLF